jgi:hypothetical protein
MSDWAKAAPLLTDVARIPNAGIRHVSNAALLQVLNGQPAVALDLASLALDQELESANQKDRTHLFVSAFLALINDSDSSQVGNGRESAFRQRLRVALASDTLKAASPAEERLRQALGAILDSWWIQAVEQLGPVAEGGSDHHARALTGFLLAVALDQAGFASEAREAFNQADAILSRMAASGDLGRRWDDFIACAVARRQAASLLHSDAPIPEIDASHLAEARDRWQPVRITLDRAFLLARQRQWVEAAAALQSAMAMEAFAWEAADLIVPRWNLKLALIFASAGDEPSYRQLCERQAAGHALSSDTKAITPFPVREKTDFNGTFWVDAHEMAYLSETEGLYKAPDWIPLLNGLDLLRQGKPDQAATEFSLAQEAYNLHCACAAYAYGAQASLLQNDGPQARAALEKAEAVLAQLQQNHGEDLGGQWFELRLCELAVNEARRMMGLQLREKAGEEHR